MQHTGIESMAVIAFFHNQLGKTDGVSLEVDKWRDVLEKRLGHTVLYCAGNDDVPGLHCIPELSFHHPDTNRILVNGTVQLKDYSSEQALLDDIHRQARLIEQKLLDFIRCNSVEVLIPNNLQSVGYHIPAMIAISRVILETGLPTICHSHDFYFEQSGEVSPTCDGVLAIFEQHGPPLHPNVRHVVINKLAQQALRQRKGVDAQIVPNVFDFDQPPWAPDDYNRDFRQAVGVGERDLIFLQATRIMNRKGIELAIDMLAELDQPETREILHARPLYCGRPFGHDDKIVLICSGYAESFGITSDYQSSLQAKAKELDVDIRFVGGIVRHSRSEENGRKLYSLWDSYVEADFVTYPSYWEGWGNQFIEAVFARKPVALFEYPVWVSDLGPAGFDVVSLGSEKTGGLDEGFARVPSDKVASAAREIALLLTDPLAYRKTVDGNFCIAKERYSYDALERIIRELLQ